MLLVNLLELRKLFGSEKRHSPVTEFEVTYNANADLIKQLNARIKEGELTEEEYHQVITELHKLTHDYLSTGTTTTIVVDFGAFSLEMAIAMMDDIAIAEQDENQSLAHISFSSSNFDQDKQAWIYGDLALQQKDADAGLRVAFYDGAVDPEVLRQLTEYFDYEFNERLVANSGTARYVAQDENISGEKLKRIAGGIRQLIDDYNNGYLPIKNVGTGHEE